LDEAEENERRKEEEAAVQQRTMRQLMMMQWVMRRDWEILSGRWCLLALEWPMNHGLDEHEMEQG